MGYRRTIAASRSRQDALAVLIVAVVTAFLVGATLLLGMTAAEVDEATAELTRDATVEYVESAPPADAGGGALRFPVAEADANGRSRLIVGVPEGSPSVVEGASYPWANATVPPPPEPGVLHGDVAATDRRTFAGRSETRRLTVEPATASSIFPADWYVAHPETVRSLGRTGALVVRPDAASASAPDAGLDRTWLSTAGTYLRRGAGSLTGLLWLVTFGEALIVGVIVYSLTRMSVADRSTTIFAARATGATKGDLTRLFALRGGLRVAAGVALGACAGLALPVAAAVGTGFLRPAEVASPPVVEALVTVAAPAAAALVAFGTLVGYAVARASVPTAPAESSATAGRRSTRGRSAELFGGLRRVVRPTVLEWRTVVPTAATLAVFVCVGLLVFSTVGTLAPLIETSGNTVVDASAPHPLASDVDMSVAADVRAAGGRASPEILVPEVVGERSRPYLARGVNYTAFAAVTESRLVRGHPPRNASQAVVGADLAETLGADVGDTLLLGGGAVPGVARVTVVGEYAASGMTDDQLLVPLRTARHLSALSEGEANLIRVEGASTAPYTTDAAGGSGESASGVFVRNYSAPDEAVAGENVAVSIRLTNLGETRRTRSLTVELGPVTERRNVTLAPGESATVRISLPVSRPGEHALRFAGLTHRFVAYPPDTARLEFAPARAPPGATLTVRAVTARGEPLANATVALAGRSIRTNDAGAARVSMPDRPGSYRLVVDAESRLRSAYPVSVAPDATRDPRAELEMPRPTVGRDVAPVSRLTLSNPWDRELARTLVFETESGWNRTREVTLGAGESTTIGTRLPRPPGDVGTLTVGTVEGGELTNGTYRVARRSDGGYGRGSGVGLGGAVERVATTLVYVQGAFVALAGLTVLGSASIVSAQAIYARRQYVGLYRVTGASPGRLLRIALADALRVGVVSSVVAVGAGLLALVGLSEVGLLTAFGVRIAVRAPPRLLVALGGLNVGIVLASVGAVTLRSLRADPAAQSESASR